jgi:hypothetical protein
MKALRHAGRIAAALLLPLSFLSSEAEGQLSYPAFQVPQIVEREFNFALADAGRATSLVFQWREGISARTQLSFDAGLSDVSRPDDNVYLLLGGQFAYQMNRPTPEAPIDMLFTAGVFTRLGEDPGSAMSVPFGVAVGYRLVLSGDIAITPYVHPRASVDMFNNDSELNLNFDFGASFDLSSELAVRIAGTIGDADGFGLSVAWRPVGLRR